MQLEQLGDFNGVINFYKETLDSYNKGQDIRTQVADFDNYKKLTLIKCILHSIGISIGKSYDRIEIKGQRENETEFEATFKNLSCVNKLCNQYHIDYHTAAYQIRNCLEHGGVWIDINADELRSGDFSNIKIRLSNVRNTNGVPRVMIDTTISFKELLEIEQAFYELDSKYNEEISFTTIDVKDVNSEEEIDTKLKAKRTKVTKGQPGDMTNNGDWSLEDASIHIAKRHGEDVEIVKKRLKKLGCQYFKLEDVTPRKKITEGQEEDMTLDEASDCIARINGEDIKKVKKRLEKLGYKYFKLVDDTDTIKEYIKYIGLDKWKELETKKDSTDENEKKVYEEVYEEILPTILDGGISREFLIKPLISMLEQLSEDEDKEFYSKYESEAFDFEKTVLFSHLLACMNYYILCYTKEVNDNMKDTQSGQIFGYKPEILKQIAFEGSREKVDSKKRKILKTYHPTRDYKLQIQSKEKTLPQALRELQKTRDLTHKAEEALKKEKEKRVKVDAENIAEQKKIDNQIIRWENWLRADLNNQKNLEVICSYLINTIKNDSFYYKDGDSVFNRLRNAVVHYTHFFYEQAFRSGNMEDMEIDFHDDGSLLKMMNNPNFQITMTVRELFSLEEAFVKSINEQVKVNNKQGELTHINTIGVVLNAGDFNYSYEGIVEIFSLLGLRSEVKELTEILEYRKVENKKAKEEPVDD